MPPEYSPTAHGGKVDGDLALILLDSAPDMPRVVLADGSTGFAGAYTVAGWGLTTAGGATSPTLQ